MRSSFLMQSIFNLQAKLSNKQEEYSSRECSFSLVLFMVFFKLKIKRGDQEAGLCEAVLVFNHPGGTRCVPGVWGSAPAGFLCDFQMVASHIVMFCSVCAAAGSLWVMEHLQRGLAYIGNFLRAETWRVFKPEQRGRGERVQLWLSPARVILGLSCSTCLSTRHQVSGSCTLGMCWKVGGLLCVFKLQQGSCTEKKQTRVGGGAESWNRGHAAVFQRWRVARLDQQCHKSVNLSGGVRKANAPVCLGASQSRTHLH